VVLDPFELQEQLEGMAVRSAAVLTSVVGEDRLDAHRVLLVENGSTSLLSTCTAVNCILLVYSRPKA
jgi:hypothetical protein